MLGSTGLAITFYTSNTRPVLDTIEKELHITIKKQNQDNSENQQQAKPGQIQSRFKTEGQSAVWANEETTSEKAKGGSSDRHQSKHKPITGKKVKFISIDNEFGKKK